MTKIEWTHRPGTVGVSWNPVTGCTPISEGCAHCYARRMARRLAGRFGYPADEPFQVTLHPDRLEEPLRWRKRRTVFVVSMGDLFHEDVPFEYIERVVDVCYTAAKHTYLVLTKRPDRMLEFFKEYTNGPYDDNEMPGNLWLGITAENQERLRERAGYLYHCPAVVRWLSYEPALGPLDLSESPRDDYDTGDILWGIDYTDIFDWVVCGGETGPSARPMRLDWARKVRDQCVAAGVPFFFKQDGKGSHLLDEQEWRQWPRAGRPETR